MAQLGTVSSNLVERLFTEFGERLSSTGSLVGTFESTERLLTKVLGEERVSLIMDEIRGPAGRTMWDKLANVNEVVLANYLKNEYPQTVAVVLSKIKPDHASRVLANLPENFAMEVIMRMLRMEAVQKEVIDDVERTLRNEFMSNLARSQGRDAHEMMAEIFNNLDRSTEDRFLQMLEDRNRDAAERIKQLMFTFEDLAKIDSAGIQTLLRAVDKDKLSIALKGASEAVRDLFFGNMSERAAKILREDMEAMGPVRLRDVEEAQVEMVVIAKDLAAKGEITIAEGDGEDELVY
jgi:flagellar motor switch protein FliG